MLQQIIKKQAQILSVIYLKLDGTNARTGALPLYSSTLDNQIMINNSMTNKYSSIKFFNGTKAGYIGINNRDLSKLLIYRSK
jgi:hypothetical protein